MVSASLTGQAVPSSRMVRSGRVIRLAVPCIMRFSSTSTTHIAVTFLRPHRHGTSLPTALSPTVVAIRQGISLVCAEDATHFWVGPPPPGSIFLLRVGGVAHRRAKSALDLAQKMHWRTLPAVCRSASASLKVWVSRRRRVGSTPTTILGAHIIQARRDGTRSCARMASPSAALSTLTANGNECARAINWGIGDSRRLLTCIVCATTGVSDFELDQQWLSRPSLLRQAGLDSLCWRKAQLATMPIVIMRLFLEGSTNKPLLQPKTFGEEVGEEGLGSGP